MKRYYLKPFWSEEWEEVTKEQYIEAEVATGFFPSPGDGSPATQYFCHRLVEGKIKEKQKYLFKTVSPK
jgi:hypothetical protein